MTVSNTGTGAANSATLSDPLPSGTGVNWSISPAYSGPGTCAISNQTLTCAFGTLASNTAASVHLTSATAGGSCGAYSNLATAAASNASSVQASASITVQCPALAATDTADVATVAAGSSIGYTVSVSNTGAGAANSATLSDPLPSGTGVNWSINPAYSGPGTCAISNQTLTCAFGTLASNTAASVHLTSATASGSCGAYSNLATAAASNASSVQASASITVQCPALAISNTPDSSSVPAGAAIGYTVTVTSTGTSTATAVTLSDPLPAGIGVTWSISPAYNGPGTCTLVNQSLTCSFNNLAANASAAVHVSGTTANSSCGQYTSQATASSGNTGPVQASATVTVQCGTLTIYETQQGTFNQSQSGVSYVATVTNSGAAATASGPVTVIETVPAGLTLVSMSGTGWNCPANGAACTRSDFLAPGASYPAITITLDVAANAGPQVTNQISVSSIGVSIASTGTPTTIVPFTCAITGDQTASVADVQLMINETLGGQPASDDLNHDGFVNIADVQKVIRAAMGLACVY